MSNTVKLSPTTYGRWVSIQLDPNDPHYFTIKMFRDKQIKPDIIDAMNSEYSGLVVQLTTEIMENYDEVQEFIANKLKERKQGAIQ